MHCVSTILHPEYCFAGRIQMPFRPDFLFLWWFSTNRYLYLSFYEHPLFILLCFFILLVLSDIFIIHFLQISVNFLQNIFAESSYENHFPKNENALREIFFIQKDRVQ